MSSWMPEVLHAPTEAQGGLLVPDSAIMHTIEGWQHVMMSPTWTRNSYHFTLRQYDGRIVQHVPINRQAWHAGNVESPSWPLYRQVNPNSHTIGISGEGAARSDMNPSNLPLAWSEPQVESAIKVLKWIQDTTGIIFNEFTLTEHSQLNTVKRFDPGPRWPKGRVLDAIRKVPMSLTADQREMLEYLGGLGASLPTQTKWDLLMSVGLPRDAKLADYEEPEEPIPTLPSQPPTNVERAEAHFANAAREMWLGRKAMGWVE